ncbi:hypothetical protein LXL04_025846 [Taraxacum kok-saghyz]
MVALEWLRPVVDTMGWDYCIVWLFGDDPSRYIEWSWCCCNGSRGVCRNVKEEIDATKQHFPQLCRDTYVNHSLRTKACEKLATIPFHLPLYSGIHGEVAMSSQPAWIHDTIGTQVLMPVNGGLIELYRSKLVQRDPDMIETLTTQFNIFSAKYIMSPKTEASPNGSNSSFISVDSTQFSPINFLGHDVSSKKKQYMKIKQKNGKELYQSKNLVTERNRRNRIKDGLFALRALVPKISKMDRASIVGDAVEYIKELQLNVQQLQNELKKLEEDESNSHEDEVEVCKPKRSHENSPTKGHSVLSVNSNTKPEVQVEVHQIGGKSFLIRLVCGQKQGGVWKTMEIVDSLGLQVVDIDITTCNGRVLNIFNVEVKGKEIGVKSLKDLLVNSWM